MKKFHPAAAAVFIAGAVAVVFRHSSYSSHGPIDTGIFVVFLVFFWWLISDFSGKRRNWRQRCCSRGKEPCFSIRPVSEPHFSTWLNRNEIRIARLKNHSQTACPGRVKRVSLSGSFHQVFEEFGGCAQD
ncbi:MAG: hypothetical protein EOS73_10995 [Mesorhizobium sp.]|uniref:hypothetical protein n=1 Tax=Mesorhizobium sp. M7A.F.Ca.ET.027.02.1.1 TaxID=2496655 RepID=UPI000FD54108|nr:hypothetical protein [Mesorhizobium sp. M7A.F.Ca.ET.027.02.1.1]RVD11515.1 hypothetical protein EN749_29890 [Mesorhizobium sp. M7A.F.Ca.ET.027.02.1.1]RWD09451.1 MAG: hypothetical protein EOS73_10995 [Mesorhizobium sp.]